MKCYRFTKGAVKRGIPVDVEKLSLYDFLGKLTIMNSSEMPEIKEVTGYYEQKIMLYSADIEFSSESLTLKKETGKTEKDIFAYIRTEISKERYNGIQDILSKKENRGVYTINYSINKGASNSQNNLLKTLVVVPNSCNLEIYLEDNTYGSNKSFKRRFENKDGFLVVPKDITEYKKDLIQARKRQGIF